MIIASVGLYVGFIDPTYAEIGSLKEKGDEFSSAVNNANKLTEKRNELVSKLNALPADDLARLNKLIPDNIDNVRLIMEIDRIALKYGMSLREVRVEGPSISASQKSAGQASTVIGGISGNYDNITLSFAVSSTYQAFKGFMGELEKSLRVLDIESAAFSVQQAAASGSDIYRFSVSLKTYWLK